MTLKTEANGSITLVNDGNYGIICDSISSNQISSYGVTTTRSIIDDVIDTMNKKPEVRLDQRSALNIGPRQVSAYYYKDGFRTDSKDLIPAIKSIEVFNKTTVKMTFVNGDVQTSTVQDGDTFSLEDGVLRCMVKEMIGKEGSAILNKLVAYAVKTYNDAETDKKKKADEEAKKKRASDKNYKKAKAHWAKKRAMERENRIQEMAEAILRAKQIELTNTDNKGDENV